MSKQYVRSGDFILALGEAGASVRIEKNNVDVGEIVTDKTIVTVNGQSLIGEGNIEILGTPGDKGDKGDQGEPFLYEDFTAEQLEALIGPKGDKGEDGIIGVDGKSAYQSAVDVGFVGTEAEWLESLKGEDGIVGVDGLSAYAIAVNEGFSGTEAQWLTSLKGEKGDKGDQGDRGADGTSVVIKGTLTLEELNALTPADVEVNDAYLVEGNLYVCVDATVPTFQDVGPIQGPKGDKGDKGDTGNGITEITKTATVGNVDTYTIYYTDSTTTEFNVTNGTAGEVTITLASDEVYQQGLSADEAPSVKQVKTDINKINTDITNLIDKLTDGFIACPSPILTSNGTPYISEIAVGASSINLDSSDAVNWHPWKAFNGLNVKTDDAWLSSIEDKDTAQFFIYFNSSVYLKTLILTNRPSGFSLSNISKFEIYGTVDSIVGSETWELLTIVNYPESNYGTSITVKLDTEKTYRGYKIQVLELVPEAILAGIGELEIAYYKPVLISDGMANILVETLTNEKVITEEKLNTVLGGYISTLSDSDIRLISERMVELKLPNKVEW